MRPQYLFSIVAVVATGAVFWRPTPPRPVTSTRDEAGLSVRITRNAPPHRFEALAVPSFENPDQTTFQLPRSYLRSRLCAGDEAMLAGVQARLLLTPDDAEEFGELTAHCGADASLCPRALAAMEADAGLSSAELQFFAASVGGCDRARFGELRFDSRLPSEVREQAWMTLPDAGAWSPELEAFINQQLAADPDGGTSRPWGMAMLLGQVREDDPGLRGIAREMMDRWPFAARILTHANSAEVKAAACARVGCDAGVEADEKEQLASCVLQGRPRQQGPCLGRLAELDWNTARLVAQRSDAGSTWRGALGAFETREAFNDFARTIAAASLADGGFTPELLLGEPPPQSRWSRFRSADGLGSDELAAGWASMAPEVKDAFFFESGDGAGGLTLWGRIDDELYDVTVRRETSSTDPRAAIALLNAMVAERGGSKRFFLVKSDWSPTVRFAEPERVSQLEKLGLIEQMDPDEARRAR